MKLLFKLTLFTTLIVVSSCATIFMGAKQNIFIDSKPQGATVFINGENSTQLTPCTIEVKRRIKQSSTNNRNEYVFGFEKDGYKNGEYRAQSYYNWLVIPDLCFYAIPAAVDLIVGSHLRYQNEVYVTLDNNEIYVNSGTNNINNKQIRETTTLPLNVTPDVNEKRVALIIGNSDYPSASLRNPVNDANAMSDELKKLGFEVITITNSNQIEMKQAISNYGTLLSKDKNTVGLFYYAGHGIQVRGKNYLVPIDAKIEKEPDVEVYCVDMDGLLSNMEYAGNNMNIIILDACRNNPFGRGFRSQAGTGLATINAPTGTIIAFATSPGSTAADGDGKNGLYTQELIKALKVQGLQIEDVFKKVRTNVKTFSNGTQIPWENSALEGHFYFNK